MSHSPDISSRRVLCMCCLLYFPFVFYRFFSIENGPYLGWTFNPCSVYFLAFTMQQLMHGFKTVVCQMHMHQCSPFFFQGSDSHLTTLLILVSRKHSTPSLLDLTCRWSVMIWTPAPSIFFFDLQRQPLVSCLQLIVMFKMHMHQCSPFSAMELKVNSEIVMFCQRKL